MTTLKIGKVHPFVNRTWQNILQKRFVHSTEIQLISSTTKLLSEKDYDADTKHPIRRSFKIIGKDFKFLNDLLGKGKNEEITSTLDEGYTRSITSVDEFQTHCDILIIGGGGVGSSIAYWLKKKARDGLNVVIADKDATYRKASAVQCFHGLNQQFSLPENIQMSLYGADFMRGVKEHLGDVNLNYTPYGSLKLASEEDAEALKMNARTQNELGVRCELLSKDKLKVKFPWLNTEDIALGCHTLEKEGWFDPLALLLGYRNKACEYGAHFVEGEVVDFVFQKQADVFVEGKESDCYQSLDKAVIRMPDGELRTVKFAICVIAAGSNSGNVGRLARIGNGSGLLSIPLPVEARRKYAYIFSSAGQHTPILSTPLTVDPNGTYFRRDGLTGNYLCGRNSNSLRTNTMDDLEIENKTFFTEIQPTLAHRVPAFTCMKVQKSWNDLFEYNSFDENGVIGTHPYYNNLYIAAGFNGHGIQQTPAVGRGMSELIIDGRFRTIDLTRLGFDRIVVDMPLYEVNSV